MDRDKLIQELTTDEGLHLYPYRDSVGKLTLGIGRCIEDNGITGVEALAMLDHDIDVVLTELDHRLSWWTRLSEKRQRALANMAFNLGLPRLLTFKKMLEALRNDEYDRAADEALDSKWAEQVGNRAKRIAKMIRKG